LTPADFERIKQLQLARKLQPALGNRKRPAPTEDEHGVLAPDALLPDRKKARQSKEERLADVMKGREDRGKFGMPKGRMSEHASTTNKEKARLKNPMMLRLGQAVQAKRNRSIGEKMWAKAGSTKKKQFGIKRRK
jgi:protein SDA1